MTDYCSRRRVGLETGPVPNIGPRGSAIIWSLVGGATAFLFLRLYCKIWRSRGIWWDDVLLIVSWVRPSFPSPSPTPFKKPC